MVAKGINCVSEGVNLEKNVRAPAKDLVPD